MKKRLVIIFVLTVLILVIQLLFYRETIARVKSEFVRTSVHRINYIIEEVVNEEEVWL